MRFLQRFTLITFTYITSFKTDINLYCFEGVQWIQMAEAISFPL